MTAPPTKRRYTKDPQAVLDYAWDWTAWLAESEVIADSTVTVEDGITKDSDSHTNTRVTVWLSGGGVRNTYTVTCHIITNQGREDERSLSIEVRDR